MIKCLLKDKINIFLNLLIILGISLMIFSSIGYSLINNKKHYTILFSFLECFLVFLFIYIYIKIKNRIDKKILKYFLVFFICIRILWIFYFKNEPVEDFKQLYETALIYLTENKNIYNESLYFYNYPYQIFFSVYELVVLKIKNNVILLQLLNIFFTYGCCSLILKISEKLYNLKEYSKIVIYIFLIYGPLYWYNCILTNQIISIFFVLLSLYFYLVRKEYILCGIALGIGQLLRPTSLIVLIAYILEICICFLENKKLKEFLKKIFYIFISYKLIIVLFSFIILKLGIYVYPLNEQPNKMHKFIVGTNDHYGILHSEDLKHEKVILEKYNILYKDNKITLEQRIKNKEIYKEINEEGKKIVLKRIKDIKIIKKFLEKFFIFFGGYDLGIDYSLKGIINSEGYLKIFRILEKAGYLFILLVALKNLLENLLNKKDRIIKLILLGYLAIYLLIEIQTRYRFELIFFLIILSANFNINIFNIKRYLTKWRSIKKL